MRGKLADRLLIIAALCAPVVLSVAVALPVAAVIETAPPNLVPEFETPAPTPTPSPIITAPLQTVDVTPIPIGGTGFAALSGVLILLWLGIAVFIIAATWRLFTKAGEPGWAAIVPIYNSIVYLKIAGRPWWWIFILWLVIPAIIATIDLAKRFGKGAGFAIGLVFLPFIFVPILAFGSAEYQPEGSEELAAPAI